MKLSHWSLISGFTAAFTALFATIITAAHAQTLTVKDIDGAAFPSVTVRVTVLDQHGRPFNGLGKDSFTVTEDGAAVNELQVDADTSGATADRPSNPVTNEPAASQQIGGNYKLTYISPRTRLDGKARKVIAAVDTVKGAAQAIANYKLSGSLSGSGATTTARAADWFFFLAALLASWVILFLPALWESARKMSQPGAPEATPLPPIQQTRQAEALPTSGNQPPPFQLSAQGNVTTATAGAPVTYGPATMSEPPGTHTAVVHQTPISAQEPAVSASAATPIVIDNLALGDGDNFGIVIHPPMPSPPAVPDANSR